jgi:hypothetical protein
VVSRGIIGMPTYDFMLQEFIMVTMEVIPQYIFMEKYQNEIHELGFIFNKIEIQEKLNERLEKTTQNISFEMGLLYLIWSNIN